VDLKRRIEIDRAEKKPEQKIPPRPTATDPLRQANPNRRNRWQRFGLLVSVYAAFLLACGSAGYAATNCEQTFTFLARTAGSHPVFWIGESVSGQCSQSYLHLLALSGPKVYGITSKLVLQKNWNWLGEAMKRFDTEQPLLLRKIGNLWKPKSARWTVKAPPENPALMNKFENLVIKKGRSLADWNHPGKTQNVVPPLLDKISAEPLYYYPNGLYVNYSIAKVLYFPRSGFLLLFTHQHKVAVGLDTMHGFILLRRSKAKSPLNR